MKYQNKRFQNIGILIVVCAFVALGFVGNAASAQTKKGKSTPTPKSKKATPTPKKNAKATPTPKKNAKSNQKTAAKTKPTPTPKKNAKTNAKTTAKKDTKTNSKTASKTDKNSKSKTTRDTKSFSKKPTVASKTANKPVNRNTKTTMPVKPKTTTTSRSTRPKTTTTTTPIKTNTNLPEIVVSSFSTTVRSAPSSTASEVTRAKLGSVYKVVDKSSGWYKVEYSNQKTGWIPTTAAVDSDKNGNDEIYRQVLAKNSGAGKMNFAESVEIYEFLTRVQPEIKDANTAAEFGLRRLIALRSALDAIPSGQSNQKIYQDFLKAQDENIVYSDPSGEWYVRAPLFWELHSKYTSTPSGERIAWEAAKNPLPGECEGYVNCYIFLLRMTDGEYLNFYPTGAHSAEALRNITTFLEPIADDADAKKVYNGPTDVSDRAEFNSLITELRVIISRLPNTEKEKALQQLKKIAEGFK